MLNTDGLVDHPTPAPYPFGPPDVASILDAGLAEHPDRVALIDGDQQWTWAELDGAVEQVARTISPGQCCWWPPGNSAEKIISILATLRAGAVWLASPTNPTKICERFCSVSLQNRSQILDPFAPALVAFTSGTTGAPKAVVHSQHSMIGPGLVSVELEPPTPDERIGTPLDLGNANIFMLGPLSALLRGSTFVVLASRYAPTLAADIATHRVTRLFAVPALAFDLLESDAVDAEQLDGLDRVILGGSGAAPELLARFATRFGVRPTLSYGMSEAPTGVVRESLDDPIGSGRGFPLPHIEIDIAGTNTALAEPGVEGEICLRPSTTGPWARTWTGTLGYLDDPERTAQLYRNGALHTGDIGRLDTDGALSVIGRISDLIIRGGTNIDPTALETAAGDVEFVTDACVVGVADERLGQIVGLAVVTTPEFAVADRLDLTDLARSINEASRIPVDAIIVVESLPRNSMGKVDRAAILPLFGPEARLS